VTTIYWKIGRSLTAAFTKALNLSRRQLRSSGNTAASVLAVTQPTQAVGCAEMLSKGWLTYSRKGL